MNKLVLKCSLIFEKNDVITAHGNGRKVPIAVIGLSIHSMYTVLQSGRLSLSAVVLPDYGSAL